MNTLQEPSSVGDPASRRSEPGSWGQAARLWAVATCFLGIGVAG